MSTRIIVPDLPIYDIDQKESLREKLIEVGVSWKTLYDGVPDYIVVITEALAECWLWYDPTRTREQMCADILHFVPMAQDWETHHQLVSKTLERVVDGRFSTNAMMHRQIFGPHAIIIPFPTKPKDG